MKKDDELKKHRENIDKIDSTIVQLLNERMQEVLEIGKQKKDKNHDFYVPSRETDVYKRLINENKGPLSKQALIAIFREVMSGALSLEKSLEIAYLGPEGTFTHQAAMNKFGESVVYYPVQTINDIFDEVAKGRCDYGVVPIENSTEGAVTHTLDMFIDYSLKICSEITLPIHHNLAVCKKDIKIKKIYSHPQVFGQCRRWVQLHYPHADLIDTESTTVAAKKIKNIKNAAAIVSELAAVKYNLIILENAIEDITNNITRFLIIGKQDSFPTGDDKTSILFSLQDRVGILSDTIQPFKKYQINLSKIESRPSKKKLWDYLFFVDLDGHAEDEHVKNALKEVESHCKFFKILGSYPKEIR